MQSAEEFPNPTESAPSNCNNVALEEANHLSDPPKEPSITTPATPQPVERKQNTLTRPMTRQRLPRAAKLAPCYTSNVDDEPINHKARKKTPPSKVNMTRNAREPQRNLQESVVSQAVQLRPPSQDIFSGFRDIICGRGCGHKTASRLSNLKYRLLLHYHRDLYDGAVGKNDKRLVCEMILEHIFEQGGRFVQMTTKEGPWETFSYEMCLSKVSQSFRDLRSLGCGTANLDATIMRPGKPTEKDMEAWQRLRSDIASRISGVFDEAATRQLWTPRKSPPKKSSPKSLKKKKKKTTPVQQTGKRVDGKFSQVPRAETTPRRVSMDLADRSAHKGAERSKKEKYTNDEGKTQQPALPVTQLGQGEWPRRVSLELGIPRSEANANGSTFSSGHGDKTSLNPPALSGTSQDLCQPESLPIEATSKCSNRSPQGDCLSNTTGRILEISPIKPSSRSNQRASQVTPSTTRSESPFQSLAAQLAQFEHMESKNEAKDDHERYKAVKCTIHSAELRLVKEEGTPLSDDSLFWDIDGSFVEISDTRFHYQGGIGDSPLTAWDDVPSHKLQDFFFPSSESIGEITDVSSSESFVMMDHIDIMMDWLCPIASDEQSLLASAHP